MDGVSAELSPVRMEVTIGADDASPEQLKELVEWTQDHSPVGCTLRHGVPIPLDIRIA